MLIQSKIFAFNLYVFSFHVIYIVVILVSKLPEAGMISFHLLCIAVSIVRTLDHISDNPSLILWKIFQEEVFFCSSKSMDNVPWRPDYGIM